jgi:PhoH-like ATPase
MAERKSGLRNLSNRHNQGDRHPSVVKSLQKAAKEEVHSKSTKKSKTKTKSKGEVTQMSASKKNVSIASSKRRLHKDTKEIITYVLDTNVLMNAWDSLFKFEEHTVCLVSQVWSELDKHKHGRSEEAYNVRKVTRQIDSLVATATREELKTGIPLIPPPDLQNGKKHTGTLLFDFTKPQVPEGLDIQLSQENPDDRILMVCLALQRSGRRVVLVSNDGNFRVKAAVCGLESEEYLYEAITHLPSEEDKITGFHQMEDDFWLTIGDNFESYKDKAADVYEFNHAMFKHVYVNQFLLLPNDVYLRVMEKPSPHKVKAVTFSHHDYRAAAVPRNLQQGFALELLLDQNVPAVSLAGLAGCGKTYLAMAAAMHLVTEEQAYDRVIVTRSATDADEEIGFLPGTEAEKMSPWLGGIYDNLESLVRNPDSTISDADVTREEQMRMMNLQVKSLNYMKGRSFERTIIIIDEVQDLSRRQVKMISTRVGQGSKIIFLGNVAQIDNRFVTEHTCGMTILISEFADSTLAGHVTLQKGERSEFATEAEERL